MMTSQTCKPLAEKEILMFQAVNELLKEGRDARDLTVQEITKKAGIGKGTAYEYFQSKEELIGKATVFGVMEELKLLSEKAEKCNSFKEIIFQVFAWIDDNVQNRQTVENLFAFSAKSIDCAKPHCPEREMGERTGNYFVSKIADIGIKEQIFDVTEHFLVESAIISQLLSYAVNMVTERIKGKEEMERFKQFTYESIIKMLRK